jgi:hypothetical protein
MLREQIEHRQRLRLSRITTSPRDPAHIIATQMDAT